MINREKANGLRLRDKTYSVEQIEAALISMAPLENFLIDDGMVTFYDPESESWMIDMSDDSFNIGACHYLEVVGAPVFTKSEDAEAYMKRWTSNVLCGWLLHCKYFSKFRQT